MLTSKSLPRAKRKKLAELAGLELAWVNCDQAVSANVTDLANGIVDELYQPFCFFRTSLGLVPRHSKHKHTTKRHKAGNLYVSPRTLFERHQATSPLSLKRGFWSATQRLQTYHWLPTLSAQAGPTNDRGDDDKGDDDENAKSSSNSSRLRVEPSEEVSNLRASSFDAVVHFVQSGSGTGVHIGHGLILTCAHVVNSQDDDDDEVPMRLGRRKLIMFPSGHVFIVRCVSVVESEDGSGCQDVAVMALECEVGLEAEPDAKCKRKPHQVARASLSLPWARVASTRAKAGKQLFCIGNPSNVDLESARKGKLDFTPPAWHASVGQCQGYRPTPGGALCGESVNLEQDGFLLHSCWTYWGHSGAPLFDADAGVVGLHCAWDDTTGMRLAQRLENLIEGTQKALVNLDLLCSSGS